MDPILLDLPTFIETPRLLLRPPQINDGKLLYPAILESFKELSTTVPGFKQNPTLMQAERFCREAAANWILRSNPIGLPFYIFKKGSTELVGNATFHCINWVVPSVQMGYWLRTSQYGYGYMTEAVNALTRYAILRLSMIRVEIQCNPIHLMSRKIPERLGYHLEATLKANKRALSDGKLRDTLIYVRHNLESLPPLE